MNLYDELGLPTNCTFDEIKQKYRILAQIHHPDKGGDEEKFKRIKLAYEVLSDPVKREKYDSTGKYGEDISIRSEAMLRLSNMIAHFTQKLNPDHHDLILSMRVDINMAQESTIRGIESLNENISKLSKFSEKTKLKQDGENILKDFVDKIMQQQKEELLHMQSRLLVFELMLEILDNYHFGSNDYTLFIE
jgi:curved DNA-binding protein CbpA